jgi:hypothetical protein
MRVLLYGPGRIGKDNAILNSCEHHARPLLSLSQRGGGSVLAQRFRDNNVDSALANLLRRYLAMLRHNTLSEQHRIPYIDPTTLLTLKGHSLEALPCQKMSNNPVVKRA